MNTAGVSGKRILVVEDDSGVRQTMEILLRAEGHKVVEASNGLEALSRFTAMAFDLVITDYAMSGMRGDELACRLKEMAPSQPVLMVTAYAEAIGTRPKGVDLMLGKPFSLPQLRQALNQLLVTDNRPSRPSAACSAT
jgi:CheY-like chemotaxis protein